VFLIGGAFGRSREKFPESSERRAPGAQEIAAKESELRVKATVLSPRALA
jgi:hypothetical protein